MFPFVNHLYGLEHAKGHCLQTNVMRGHLHISGASCNNNVINASYVYISRLFSNENGRHELTCMYR